MKNTIGLEIDVEPILNFSFIYKTYYFQLGAKLKVFKSQPVETILCSCATDKIVFK